jgi:hypothetical protein
VFRFALHRFYLPVMAAVQLKVNYPNPEYSRLRNFNDTFLIRNLNYLQIQGMSMQEWLVLLLGNWLTIPPESYS